MRTLATKQTAINQYNGLGNQLWDLSGQRPTLDLRFAEDRTLVDATTGSNLVTHTRQSSATYVDGDGVIRTAVTNLLLQSEDFSTTWTIQGTATVTANSTVAPDGQTTADTLSTRNSGIDIVSGSVTVTASATVTGSIYVKTGGTTPFIRFQISDGSGNGFRVWVNNSTGAIGTPETFGTGTVTSVGNGWFRIAITGTCGTATSINTGFAGANVDGGFSRTSGQTYILWGAQIEQSSTVGQYVKTTTAINSAPRFDHDPTTGESLGLLVEESRQNLLLQSEDFSTTWTVNAATVGTAIAAPDGTTTAQKIEEDNTTAEHRASQLSSGGATTSAVCLSVFAKAAERTKIRLVFSSLASWVGGGGAGVIYDLATGTAAVDGSTPTAFGIVPYPNGWYRCFIVGTPSASLTPTANIFLYTTAYNYAGTTGSGLYLWGAQLEADSFPTSYIPTEGSTVTRAADVTSITGTNFSSWYEQSEGTVFVEVKSNNDSNTGGRVVSFNDNSSNERIECLFSKSTEMQFIVSHNNSTQASFTEPVTKNANNKVAIGVIENNTLASFNGSSESVDTSCIIPTVNQVNIGTRQSASNPMNGTIRRLTYWPSRLSNDTLQTITQ
jgi:hypothetical protein